MRDSTFLDGYAVDNERLHVSQARRTDTDEEMLGLHGIILECVVGEHDRVHGGGEVDTAEFGDKVLEERRPYSAALDDAGGDGDRRRQLVVTAHLLSPVGEKCLNPTN